ncbi:MAG: LytTR family DNA-binding domain-containing protein [Cyclobacteriaceae bacterium]
MKSKKLKCLIVDDEPIAQEILEQYIGMMEGLQLIGKCKNAIEAHDVLQKGKIDLMLLDIEMPHITGLNFLANLTNPPKVIITTAYREYALEGFELNAVDYLLKPISLERFMRAIEKVQGKHSLPEAVVPERAYIYLKADKKMVQVFLDDIQYIEGLSNYVKIHLNKKMIISYQKLSHLEKILPKNDFVRVHRSFIVSRLKVKSYTQGSVEVGVEEIPIGGSYKKKALGILKTFEV